MSPDGELNGPGFLSRNADDEGEILLSRLALGELGGEAVMGSVTLGHDDDPAGFLVESVDDAGTSGSANRTQVVSAMVEESVDEGVVSSAVARVNDHARGLVDNNEVFVLVKDIKGQFDWTQTWSWHG